jgi:hypothetical protein
LSKQFYPDETDVFTAAKEQQQLQNQHQHHPHLQHDPEPDENADNSNHNLGGDADEYGIDSPSLPSSPKSATDLSTDNFLINNHTPLKVLSNANNTNKNNEGSNNTSLTSLSAATALISTTAATTPTTATTATATPPTPLSELHLLHNIVITTTTANENENEKQNEKILMGHSLFADDDDDVYGGGIGGGGGGGVGGSGGVGVGGSRIGSGGEDNDMLMRKLMLAGDSAYVPDVSINEMEFGSIGSDTLVHGGGGSGGVGIGGVHRHQHQNAGNTPGKISSGGKIVRVKGRRYSTHSIASSYTSSQANTVAATTVKVEFASDFDAAAPTLQQSVVWEQGAVVTELLDYYVDQGDVQTCVCVAMVLGMPMINRWVSARRVEQMMAEYVDMLRRLQLHTIATDFIKDNVMEAIAMQNQESTTIYIGCSQCNKTILGTGTVCEKCKRQSSNCAVCHVGVKGLATWCQGCGHGGHQQHMQQWFKLYYVCPVVGCGHHCTL